MKYKTQKLLKKRVCRHVVIFIKEEKIKDNIVNVKKYLKMDYVKCIIICLKKKISPPKNLKISINIPKIQYVK